MPTGDAATLRAVPDRVESPMRSFLLLIMMLAATPAPALEPLTPPPSLAAPPAGAVETASGMSYVVLAPAKTPERMASGEFVEFRLDMWSSDGVTRASARETGPRTVAV